MRQLDSRASVAARVDADFISACLGSGPWSVSDVNVYAALTHVSLGS